MKEVKNLSSYISFLISLKRLFRVKKFTLGFAAIATLAIIGSAAPLLTTRNPVAPMTVPMDQPPSQNYPLGTDTLGRDLFAQLVYGIRSSLVIGLVAGSIGLTIGIVLGFMSGFKPGILDMVLTRFIDVFLVIPVLPLLVIIASMIRGTTIYLLATIIGLFSWPWTARSIRSQVISLREREFISLSKLSNMNDLEIAFKEILPNMLPYLGALFAGAVAGAMAGEAGIALLGLGPMETSTLGIILYWATGRGAVVRGLWWWWLPPTACFIVIFISLQSINMGLEEIYNPRLRR